MSIKRRKRGLASFCLLLVLFLSSMGLGGTRVHAEIPGYQASASDSGSMAEWIWADYEAYARPTESGYSYYLYNDQDISSEILPLDDQQAENIVLLTFDDTPNEGSHALEIAQSLKDQGVNAIFLVNGHLLEDEVGRQIVQEIAEMGFELGNHSYSHLEMNTMTYEEQYQEIASVNEWIEAVSGRPIRWFRPPFGLYNMATLEVCNDLGLQVMNWSFGYDWMEEYQEAEALAEISLNTDYLHNGVNILMHDLPWTAGAITDIVQGYQEAGYHIVDPYLIVKQANALD